MNDADQTTFSPPPPPPPPPFGLEYAQPAGPDAQASPVFEVSADGAWVRVRRPRLWVEILSAAVYSLGVAAFCVPVITVVWQGFTRGFARDWPYSLFCAGSALAFAFAFAIPAARALRTIARILRRDPRLGTQFFDAADVPASRRVDPVRSVEVRREQVQANFRWPHSIRIVTKSGRTTRILLGRPVAELDAVAADLRAALRLDAKPTNAFPVVMQRTGGA